MFYLVVQLVISEAVANTTVNCLVSVASFMCCCCWSVTAVRLVAS